MGEVIKCVFFLTLFLLYLLSFHLISNPFCLTNANQFHACQSQSPCDRECLDKLYIPTYHILYIVGIHIYLFYKFFFLLVRGFVLALAVIL